MCRAAIAHKLDITKQLGVVLQGTVKPSMYYLFHPYSILIIERRSRNSVITQCCIHELYILGKSDQPAVDLAKTFERRKCNHREAVPGDDCLASVIGTWWVSFVDSSMLIVPSQGDTNKHRYVVATQSQPLRGKLRLIPAVPVVHVTRSVMILEPPADATLRAKAMVRCKTLLIFPFR